MTHLSAKSIMIHTERYLQRKSNTGGRHKALLMKDGVPLLINIMCPILFMKIKVKVAAISILEYNSIPEDRL